MNTYEPQELFHTTNIKVATALLTLGFEKVTTSIVIRNDQKESMVFWFKSRNDEGVTAAYVHHGMTKGGQDLANKDPENVINYMRVFAANRDELISDIRNTPRMVEVEVNGKMALIREGASAETKSKVSKLL